MGTTADRLGLGNTGTWMVACADGTEFMLDLAHQLVMRFPPDGTPPSPAEQRSLRQRLVHVHTWPVIGEPIDIDVSVPGEEATERMQGGTVLGIVQPDFISVD